MKSPKKIGGKFDTTTPSPSPFAMPGKAFGITPKVVIEEVFDKIETPLKSKFKRSGSPKTDILKLDDKLDTQTETESKACTNH